MSLVKYGKNFNYLNKSIIDFYGVRDFEKLIKTSRKESSSTLFTEKTLESIEKIANIVDLPNNRSLDDFLIIRNRSISAESFWGFNQNYDSFPDKELIAGYQSFINQPITIDHTNTGKDDEVIGCVLDSIWVPPQIYKREGHLIPWTEQEEKKMVVADSFVGNWVNNLWAVDKIRAEKKIAGLIAGIQNGELSDTSMGTTCNYSECSICGNQARYAGEYCDHIKRKGQLFDVPEQQGPNSKKVAFERNFGLEFFEDTLIISPEFAKKANVRISAGGEGADYGAKFVELIQRSRKVANSFFQSPAEQAGQGAQALERTTETLKFGEPAKDYEENKEKLDEENKKNKEVIQDDEDGKMRKGDKEGKKKTSELTYQAMFKKIALLRNFSRPNSIGEVTPRYSPGPMRIDLFAGMEKCPECGSPMEQKGNYTLCSNKDCKNYLDEPEDENKEVIEKESFTAPDNQESANHLKAMTTRELIRKCSKLKVMARTMIPELQEEQEKDLEQNNDYKKQFGFERAEKGLKHKWVNKPKVMPYTVNDDSKIKRSLKTDGNFGVFVYDKDSNTNLSDFNEFWDTEDEAITSAQPLGEEWNKNDGYVEVKEKSDTGSWDEEQGSQVIWKSSMKKTSINTFDGEDQSCPECHSLEIHNKDYWECKNCGFQWETDKEGIYLSSLSNIKSKIVNEFTDSTIEIAKERGISKKSFFYSSSDLKKDLRYIISSDDNVKSLVKEGSIKLKDLEEDIINLSKRIISKLERVGYKVLITSNRVKIGDFTFQPGDQINVNDKTTNMPTMQGAAEEVGNMKNEQNEEVPTIKVNNEWYSAEDFNISKNSSKEDLNRSLSAVSYIEKHSILNEGSVISNEDDIYRVIKMGLEKGLDFDGLVEKLEITFGLDTPTAENYVEQAASEMDDLNPDYGMGGPLMPAVPVFDDDTRAVKQAKRNYMGHYSIKEDQKISEVKKAKKRKAGTLEEGTFFFDSDK